MESVDDTKSYWTICPLCRGQGKVVKGPSRKRLRLFQIELENYTTGGCGGAAPKPPTGNLDVCFDCSGSGLVDRGHSVRPDFQKYPTVAIIGGGIGGVALAVACLHRGIPFTLYERDESFDSRSQGYGLTLQQASQAMKCFGISSMDDGITSTRHVVHDPNGAIIGEWGLRRWKKPYLEKTTSRKNVHIARQTLRQLLLQQLGSSSSLKWGHTLTDISYGNNHQINLTFRVGEQEEVVQAGLIVGADGIRSMVRKLVIGSEQPPLNYIGCIVILGICPLEFLDGTNPLLDGATVFQTVNGHDRIYVMPYDADRIMWQFSCPMPEVDAQVLGRRGAQAMKDEVISRLQGWHDPIPEMLAVTPESTITGYPVYDRSVFDPALLAGAGSVTLIGDAAHPMSPFKGQGANQALLDALSLARRISVACDQNPRWRETGIRNCVLSAFESEMAERSASKVTDSAIAAKLLHSNAVLHTGDTPRGRGVAGGVDRMDL